MSLLVVVVGNVVVWRVFAHAVATRPLFLALLCCGASFYYSWLQRGEAVSSPPITILERMTLLTMTL